MQDDSEPASDARGAQRAYRLLEIHADGREFGEAFDAPDDDVAMDRALSVSRAATVELWRGATLIRRWTPGLGAGANP